MTTTPTSAKYQPVYDEHEAHLRMHARAAGIDDLCVQPMIDHLLPRFARADATALREQRSFTVAAVTVYCLSALAVSVAIAQWLFLTKTPRIVALEVLAMLVALSIIFVGRRRRWKRRWLEARYRAERLRAATYTAVLPGGLQEAAPAPGRVLGYYGWAGEEVEGELRAALDHADLEHCRQADVETVKKFLVRAWIEDQAAYNEAAAAKKSRRAGMTRLALFALFSVTLVAAVVHMFGEELHLHGAHGEAGFLEQVAVLLCIVCPAWACAIHGIDDLLDRERIAARSAGMASLLRAHAERAKGATTMEELRDTAAAASWIMATESHEWLVSLGFRQPPPVPT